MCPEFADVREEAKALLKEVASRRGGGGREAEAEQADVTQVRPRPAVSGGTNSPLQGSVVASRLRPHLSVQGSPSPRRDLEPVNLNFTP